MLTAFDVDDICDRIIAGTTSEQITQDITAKNGNVTHQEGIFGGLSFKDFVQKAADCYCQNHRWPKKPILSGGCFGCPYKTVSHPELKSGMKECWTQYVSDGDFEHRPQVKELSGFGLAKKRGEWVEKGVYFLDEIGDQRMPHIEHVPPGSERCIHEMRQAFLSTREANDSCITTDTTVGYSQKRTRIRKHIHYGSKELFCLYR